MTPLKIEFICRSKCSFSKCSCLLARKKSSCYSWNHSQTHSSCPRPRRQLCRVNGIAWGSRLASGWCRQDFPKSNKHCSRPDGKREHAHQQKKKQPNSLSLPISFYSIVPLSVYSSSQLIILVSNSIVLCPLFLCRRKSIKCNTIQPYL